MGRALIAIDATLAGGDNTGDSTYWTGLLGGLARAKSEFDFVLLSNKSKPSGLELPGEWLKLRGAKGRWFSLVTLPLKARRLGAAAFHTQYNLSPLAFNGITTIHDVSFFVGPQWFKPKDLYLLRRFVPASARRAKKVITVTHSSKADIVKFLRVPENKVAVTYNAPNPAFRPVPPEESTGAAAKAGLDGPYLITMGARWPRKNLALAIQAAGMLPETIPHKLLVVGKKGWGEEGGNSRTVSSGYVEEQDLVRLMSGADLYLCPSHYEGFGIPIVEAFAAGTPVLTSAGGSLPEIAGGAAEILEDMTPEAWCRRIVELLGDSSKLASMRERGFTRAKDFSWDKTAAATLEVYREAVS